MILTKIQRLVMQRWLRYVKKSFVDAVGNGMLCHSGEPYLRSRRWPSSKYNSEILNSQIQFVFRTYSEVTGIKQLMVLTPFDKNILICCCIEFYKYGALPSDRLCSQNHIWYCPNYLFLLHIKNFWNTPAREFYLDCGCIVSSFPWC